MNMMNNTTDSNIDPTERWDANDQFVGGHEEIIVHGRLCFLQILHKYLVKVQEDQLVDLVQVQIYQHLPMDHQDFISFREVLYM